MERYTFLSHTADAKFQAFGKTLEEAFSNAALALSSLMWDWEQIEKRKEYPIEVKGNDLLQLLNKFLGEIIYLRETKLFLLSSAEKLKIQKIKIISAWRYPARSPIGKPPPIPEDILWEVKNL